MSLSRLLVWGATFTVAFAGQVPRAAACGGTFCDAGPVPMPVDQTGENILFVMDGDHVEAHVQIQYEGEAERFAWVVPIQAEPEVTVGSQPLFASLLQQTVPTYLLNTQLECQNAANGFNGATGGGDFGAGGSGGGPSGPDILFEETVGSFDVTVLASGDATEVTDWLIENDYELEEEAPAILADYVQAGHVFAAIKLTAGADVDEIHPLVFRYEGNEPCVPLKLTAVAAKADMAVRTFFLGDDRVYPLNYKHVELNPVRLDWVAQGGNYTTVVSRAVDEPVADGQAFVTEYAGPSSGVNNPSIFSSVWNSDAFLELAPSQVLGEMTNQGVVFCDPYTCNFIHPLALPLLREFVPVPSDQDEGEYYLCLANGGAAVLTGGGAGSGASDCVAIADEADFDGAQFAEAYEDRIVTPGRHADQLLTTWPYLTRMFTTIDPEEMTVDPMFHARREQSPTVSPNRSATQFISCEGETYVDVSGRDVALDNGAWPLFSSAMPWAERIEEVPAEGETIVLVDNAELIDEELAAWNEISGVEIPAGTGGTATTNTSTTGSDGSQNGSGGSQNESGGSAGVGGETGSSGTESGDGSGDDGCSCALPGQSRPGKAGMMALLVLAVFARRRAKLASSKR